MASHAASMTSTTYTGELFTAWRDSSGQLATDLFAKVEELGVQEHWLVPYKQVELRPDKVLGSGGFGVVMAAVYHGAEVVVKAPKSDKVIELSGLALVDELRAFRRLRHPYVAAFYGACLTPGNCGVTLVLEYIHGTVLDNYVKEPPSKPSALDRCLLANHVCCALSYLHAQTPAIVHGDVKGSNVIVEDFRSRPCAKLVDFGLSRILGRRSEQMGGTAQWSAPEVLLNTVTARHAPATDVFSFGRLLYVLITGRRPLHYMPQSAILACIKDGCIPELKWAGGVPLVTQGQQLVAQCCHGTASVRPTMLEVRAFVLDWKINQNDAMVCVKDCIPLWEDECDSVLDGVKAVVPQEPPPSAEVSSFSCPTASQTTGEESHLSRLRTVRSRETL